MGEYRLGGFSSGELRAGLKGNLKTFAGNMAVSGRGKLLLFSEFKDRNGGDGGWAWRGRGGNSSQSRESRQKAAIFYKKKSKKLFSSFLSLNFTSFFFDQSI